MLRPWAMYWGIMGWGDEPFPWAVDKAGLGPENGVISARWGLPMKSAGPKLKMLATRRGGRPRQNLTKDDPAYQPTQAELKEDVSIPNVTPEKLAQVMFGEARQPRIVH